MGYDDRDRRYEDDQPPRRPSRPRDDAPRSYGPPSRPRDDGAGARSDRPRSGDTPPRSRPSSDGQRSGTPSRPRSGDTPSRGRSYDGYGDYDTPSRSSRRAGDDDYGSRAGPPSRPRSGDTPARSRSADDYGDYGAPSGRDSRRRDDATSRRSSGGGARDALRRVRDSFTGTFESMRARGRGSDDRSATPSRSRRDEGYGRSADWDEGDYGDERSSRRSAAVTPPANLNDRDGGTRSLARRLITRRRRVREGGMPPGQRAVITAVTTVIALLIIIGGGFGVGYAYADSAKYNKTIMQLGVSQDLRSSRIYDRHGTLLYQTLGQNSDHRFYLNYCQLPEVIKWATIDAEDHNFWSETTGIDPIGLIRAAQVNLTHSGGTQGGSTITQQLVKLAVLGDSSRNIGRKIDEAILAVNVSQVYTRQDILTMYLNIVPYGFNNDGIEAAARAYFHLQPIDIRTDQPIPAQYQDYVTKSQRSSTAGAAPLITQAQYQDYVTKYQQCAKDHGIKIENNTITLSSAWQLENWQAELLAGVPNNPNSYNPFLAPNYSTDRMRDGVLIQMEKYGHGSYITKPDGKGGEQQVGRDELHDYVRSVIHKPTDGDPKTYQRAIYANQYQGTNGLQELAPYFVEYVIQQLEKYFVNGREGFATAGWNVYTTLDYGKTVKDDLLSKIYIAKDGTLTAVGYDPKKDTWLGDVGIQQYADYLTRRDITQDYPNFWYCGSGYAHPDPKRYGDTLPPSQNPFSTDSNVCWETPLNNSYTHLTNGALTAIDPRNGDILAMVGGVDYAKSPFNVATSPNRSMGSSFKPISYATAFEMGWNPGILATDQPTCFPDAESTEKGTADALLCPGHFLAHNYTPFEWSGQQPITYLLGNSLNTPAMLSLSFAGLRAGMTDPSPMVTMAQRLGIHTTTNPLGFNPNNLGPSAAIGTLPVPLLELTSAYGTFANHGNHQTPRSILQVTTPDGQPVYDRAGNKLFPYIEQPQGYQAISPQSAYEITSILTNNTARIADFGHYNPLYFPGRDVAAKTGTSDAKKDIVTMGYSPWLALGVWAGNNDSTSAGDQVIGIAGAGYIFHDVMAFAINRFDMPGTLPTLYAKEKPGGYFPVPAGMHRAILNCKTGLAPWNGVDVNDPKNACNPSQQNRVPDAMSTEFAPQDCLQAGLKGGKPIPAHPNQTLNCWGNAGKNKYYDSWQCLGWGCNNQGANDPGQDIAWIPDGQDPTVP